jgi:flagellar motor switch protein FliN/FliY
MTDLEAKIVTAFNDYLYNAVSQLVEKPGIALKRTNFDVIHLTLIVRDPETKAGAKFMVSLPEVLLHPQSIASSGEKFSHESFLNSTIPADIKIGTTRIPVFDLKHIDVEDVVVFDKSNIHKMTLKMDDYIKDFNVSPNMALAIPMDNDGGDYMAETNLWDSLEVEMTAQFDKTMITLGNLKAIEENNVVDIASVYDNNVTLSVEGKTIAIGELVIVNDRYGVKI